MTFWHTVQQNSETLLAEGLCQLVRSPPVMSVDALPKTAGVILQFRKDTCFHVTDTDNLRQTARSVTNEHLAEWHKARRREYGPYFPSIASFDLQAMETSIGRRELCQFVQFRLHECLRQMRSDRTGAQKNRPTDLWDRTQLSHSSLLDEGRRLCLHSDQHRWGHLQPVKGAGVLLIWNRHDEVIFIEETPDLDWSYQTHAQRTPLSELRQNVGTRFLGLQLKQQQGGGCLFSASEEMEVSAFLKTCRVTVFNIAVGRLELAESLIGQLHPSLNNFHGHAPFERSQEFSALRQRKHFVWG